VEVLVGFMDKVKDAAAQAVDQAKAEFDDSRGAVLGGPAAPPAAPTAYPTTPALPAPRVPEYVVVQVVLKEKLIGAGSGNLSNLENAINAQARKGYRLHTITTASSGSGGFGGGDRIQATMVFEKL
jgi:hypothetical protein